MEYEPVTKQRNYSRRKAQVQKSWGTLQKISLTHRNTQLTSCLLIGTINTQNAQVGRKNGKYTKIKYINSQSQSKFWHPNDCRRKLMHSCGIPRCGNHVKPSIFWTHWRPAPLESHGVAIRIYNAK